MTDKPKKKPRRTLDQIAADIASRQSRERKVLEVRESRDQLGAAIGAKEWPVALDWAKALVLQLEALATPAPEAPAAQLDLDAAEGAS